jgi:predicted MFS family arabinose efflux permease
MRMRISFQFFRCPTDAAAAVDRRSRLSNERPVPAESPQHRIFYGWWVLAACVVGLAFGYSNAAYLSFGLFVLPLTEAHGWGRGDISVGSTIMSLCVAALAPVAGTLIDRYGPRRVLLPSIVLFSATMAAMWFLTAELWHFYLMCVLIAVTAVCTAPATYARVVVNWFDRRRGLALGVALTGIGVGAAIVPPLVQAAVANWGWRAAYLVLAGCVLATLPVLALVLRDDPREMGLAPDNDRSAAAAARKHPSTIGWLASQAIRRPVFWLMVFSFTIFGAYTLGVVVHLVPLLIDRGLDRSTAALAASSLGFALIAGRLVAGYLLDRLFAPHVVVGVMLAPVMAMAALAMGASSTPVVFACAILLGIGLGAELDFMSYLLSRYFGLRAYAQLYGYMYGVFALGSAIGPLFMGYVYQSQGTYVPALWTLCGLTAVALLPFLMLGPYPTLPGAEDSDARKAE